MILKSEFRVLSFQLEDDFAICGKDLVKVNIRVSTHSRLGGGTVEKKMLLETGVPACR